MFWWMLLTSALAALAASIALATIAAQRLLRPRRRQAQSTPAEVGLAYQEVQFKARGEALALAAWYIPAAGATRAVIIAHGVGGCRGQEFTVSSFPLVEHLVGSGFSVLMLDLRGHGASDTAPMTYGIRERHDLLGAVDWLLAHGYKPGAIGVLGASMGGVAAMGAAGEEPAIGALISDSACADFQAMIESHLQRRSKLPRFFIPLVLLMGRMLSGEDLARLRPATLLRQISACAVLIIHAEGDRLVPLNHAYALARAGDCALWITQSPRHLGSFGANQHAYSQCVIAFFERTLVARPPIPAAFTVQQLTHAHQPGRLRLHMRWERLKTGLRARWEPMYSAPPRLHELLAQPTDDTVDEELQLK
ncbi:alpha/beta fold hydrolase [Candidatus Gracilibacteria bacterium]|nr:alpha/beta fold hydrolase [Candidatus Gracilibacteria bacterium]